MNNDERMLNAAISNFKSENGIKKDKMAFDYFTISQILKNKDIDFDFDDIDNSLVDNGGDGGIDSLSVFINDKFINSVEELEELKGEFDSNTFLHIYIIQNKEQNSFKESVFEKLIPTFRDIFNFSLNDRELVKVYNVSLVEKIILLREAIESVLIRSNNVSLFIKYACKGNTNNVSPGVKHKQESLRTVIEEMISIPNISIEILGSNELRTLFVDRIENELILKYDSQISASSGEGESIGYIATVKLKNYFEFVSKDKRIRESILESNIRHYQGSVSVNRKMSETLLNDKDIEFWWLNNGISILVSEIIPLPNNKLKLKDPQVVNGLQTTFCIADYIRDNDPEEESRTVLIKIIKTTDSRNIDKVISSTNSQTEVRPADLRATDDLQRDIEQYFLSQGYYYDRRKNYYKNLNKERNKIFTIAKTAQYIETILFKRPHAARSNPTTLLKSDDSYKRIFNKDTNIEAYLKSCMVYKNIDSYIKEYDKDHDPLHKTYGASMKHFAFHIMFIAVGMTLCKSNFSADDLANIKTEDINIEILDQAIALLITTLNSLSDRKEFENAISLAKVKSLTDEILKELEVYLSTGKTLIKG
ncbi:AIPR family protein [Fictibacillus enclensis]|uniref:AIPR family protein n=1 Tax=Fictibacillus enclensis TaxID=1017270 RepID=UPI0024C0954C|nr:AIPR family protein [Fictibacillus enclensis]WHY72646.1 AIPR family protein [Fictibacillus enclensis]